MSKVTILDKKVFIKQIYKQNLYNEEINADWLIQDEINNFIKTLDENYLFDFSLTDMIIYKNINNRYIVYFTVEAIKKDNDCILRIYKI